jgi:CRP-like cAMP-binding protein
MFGSSSCERGSGARVTEAATVLARSTLFGALPQTIRVDVGRLMSPVGFEGGELVFGHGSPGDHLIVVEEGRLEASLPVPGGEPVVLSAIGSGDVIGELSLLGDGRRTATVCALEPSRGWRLDRPAFEALRVGTDRAATAVAGLIGRQAVQRLAALYRRTATEMPADPPPASRPTEATPTVESDAGDADDSAYLSTVRFFEHFEPDAIPAVVRGLPRLAVPRGEVIVEAGAAPRTLWIVIRGAVETVIRGRDVSRRMRLAGPGRAVGHTGLLGKGDVVDHVESRARERAVLIELSWNRVHELLGGEDRASHAFANALWTDTVRALQSGERPLAQMSVARATRPAGFG